MSSSLAPWAPLPPSSGGEHSRSSHGLCRGSPRWARPRPRSSLSSPLGIPRRQAPQHCRRTTHFLPRAAQAADSEASPPAPAASQAPSPVSLDQASRELDQSLARIDEARKADEEQARAARQGQGGPTAPLGMGKGGGEEGAIQRQALALARALAEAGTLRGFGTAEQVPRRVYTMDELRLHKIEPAKLLAPRDSTLGSVRSWLQLALLGVLVGSWWILELDQYQLLGTVVFLLALGTTDQILTGGAVEALAVDSVGHSLVDKYRNRVGQHEAGHFLIAYLLGVLPSSYTISSLDALQQTGVLTGQQAGTTLVDVEWQDQVRTGQVTSQLVDTIACVSLAGVCAEYITYGVAEGGISDIRQLDSLFLSLRFTQKKSDEVVRWAVLNTVTLLRKNKELLKNLKECMLARKSVGECIATIERQLGST